MTARRRSGRSANGDGMLKPRVRHDVAWAFAGVALVVWQLLSSSGVVDDVALPSPVGVGSALFELFRTGEIWKHLGASLARILGGWSLGTILGLAVGVAMGTSTVARSIGTPLVAALFPIPKIALLPLFILWLGIGEASKLVTIAVGVFFPTVIASYTGVDSVPRAYLRMGQSFGLGARDVVWKILLPGALPGILAGFRISSSIALIVVVAAEMIGAEHGIGALVLTAGHLLQTDRLLAGVAVLSVIGLLVAMVIEALERHLLRWR